MSLIGGGCIWNDTIDMDLDAKVGEFETAILFLVQTQTRRANEESTFSRWTNGSFRGNDVPFGSHSCPLLSLPSYERSRVWILVADRWYRLTNLPLIDGGLASAPPFP